MWLCQLSVVLAFGESYSSDLAPALLLDEFDSGRAETARVLTDQATPPGTEMFEQGLKLLKIPYEGPTIEHVEALNLFVSTPSSTQIV